LVGPIASKAPPSANTCSRALLGKRFGTRATAFIARGWPTAGKSSRASTLEAARSMPAAESKSAR
jgi:hypothetical protein